MGRWDRILIALFLAVILIPGGGLLFGVEDEGVRGENRTLVSAPAIHADVAALRALPDAFSRYVEDRFALRSWLVRTQADLRFRLLGVSPSPDVVVGRDGWYFYAGDGAIEDYTSAEPMSAEDLEVWRQTLQDTQDWLAAQGIAYLFVVAPDKHAVYPEMMPRSIHRLREEWRTDELVRYLRQRSTVNVLDLRPALIEAKARERIYQRTDTHWNDRGAIVAYQQVVGALGGAAWLQAFGLEALPRSAYRDTERRVPGLDLAAMMGLEDRVLEDDLALIPLQSRRARVVEPEVPEPHGVEARLATEIEDLRLPRAVFFRDSFASSLVPFLSEHFSRALYLWEYDLDPEVIAQERPNVVVQEYVGRRFGTLLPYNAVAGRLKPAPTTTP